MNIEVASKLKLKKKKKQKRNFYFIQKWLKLLQSKLFLV